MSESSAIREFALAFPKAFEDHPFGPDTHVFKVGGKSMFVILSDGPPVKVTVKLTKEERQVALEMPYVREARYVGRYGWITAVDRGRTCPRRHARVDPRELLAEGAGRHPRSSLG